MWYEIQCEKRLVRVALDPCIESEKFSVHTSFPTDTDLELCGTKDNAKKKIGDGSFGNCLENA